MTATQLLALLNTIAPSLIPVIQGLEAEGNAELKTLIGGVQNATLKALLMDLDVAIDQFAQTEIAKI